MTMTTSQTDADVAALAAACRTYLDTTGWSGDPLLPIIASLAYKQGAGHQENAEMMQAAVAAQI